MTRVAAQDEPMLVTVAHGTRDPAGNQVAAAVTARAARLLGVPVTAAYVELCEPSLESVMAAQRTPAVVVPLLLSTGYHTRHDVPGAVTGAPVGTAGRIAVGGPLGPDPMLAQVMRRRLLTAGAAVADPVVVVAAGSNDPAAADDVAGAARLLQAGWQGPVTWAGLSGAGPRVADAVLRARRHGRVAVAPYLLAPGFFASRAAREAEAAGAAVVAEVIGAHPLVGALVADRYRAQVAALGGSLDDRAA